MRYYTRREFHKGKIDKDLEILNEILNKNMTDMKSRDEFTRLSNRSESTYYRYKRYLLRKTDHISYIFIHKRGGCYFCNSPKISRHHINFNRKDNRKDNILHVCDTCHMRLHAVFKRYQILSETV